MTNVLLKDVRKSYGPLEVIHGIDLEINSGEFVVFVGPSGCGKSTLLRMVAGLEHITGGQVAIDDQVVNDVPSPQRGIAMVFQSYALYPHMTVYDNMAFGLKLAKRPKGEIDKRVREVAKILQIEDYLERMPRALSGGQRQRVAIGRALVRNPKVFLFDEPLSNLDAALRADVRLEIARLHNDLGATMIYVTHDQVEAMTLADRIVVMNQGRIEQVGSPRELYETPANTFVATFIGSPKMTLVKVTRDGDRLSVPNGGSIAMSNLPPAAGAPLIMGVRPDALTIARGAHDEGFAAKVIYAEYLGDHAYVYAQLADGKQIVARAHPGEEFSADETITVTPDPAAVHFFSVEDGKRLSA